jgi:hypothetical protein
MARDLRRKRRVLAQNVVSPYMRVRYSLDFSYSGERKRFGAREVSTAQVRNEKPVDLVSTCSIRNRPVTYSKYPVPPDPKRIGSCRRFAGTADAAALSAWQSINV